MGLFHLGRGYSSEPQVERIDLRGDHIKKRTAAAILLAAVGIAALVWAVNGLLSRESGWTAIEADTSEKSCAGEFVFYYHLGADDSSPSAQYKALTVVYSQAAADAEQLFSVSVEDGDIRGLRLLNRHVNEPVTLEKEVWEALSLLNESESREMFLAPVYEQYTTLFFCSTDEEAGDLDPYRNEEQRALLLEMAAFANDPQHIRVILEDGNRATLCVSDEYLRYAKENGIETFVDLYWMKNAFAADYMAEKMAAQGFTDGYLTCGDGFTRSLGGNVSVSCLLYDRTDKRIYEAASVDFGKVKSVVMFHDFPLSKTNDRFYYQFADGEMVTPYVEPSDGLCQNAVSCLAVYSDTRSCAQAVLAARKAYVAEDFRPDALKTALGDADGFVWCQDCRVIRSSGRVSASDLYHDDEMAYAVETLS